MTQKTAKLTPDRGVVDNSTRTITFIAVPYPLPQAWRDRLIRHTADYPGNFAGLKAIEIEMRGAIGFEYTRPDIPPVERGNKHGGSSGNVNPSSVQELWG